MVEPSIIFVSDCFYGEYSALLGKKVFGGAEAHDQVMLEHIKTSGIKVTKVLSSAMTEEFVHSNKDAVWLITNFGFMSEEAKQALLKHSTRSYYIYEHDHKYVYGRNLIGFPNFVAPAEYVANKEFLLGANRVYVNTVASEKSMKNHLGNKVQTLNMHGNFFGDLTYNKILSINKKPKNGRFVIVQDLSETNLAKNGSEAEVFCKQHGMEYDIIGNLEYFYLLEKLSEYSTLVYFASCVDTFCRLVAEAKMLGCQVVSDPGRVGFYSEPGLVRLSSCSLVKELWKRELSGASRIVEDLSYAFYRNSNL